MTSTTGARPASVRHSRTARAGAFTLLELVFVLMVAGIAAMLAAPLLGGFLRGRGIQHAASSIVSLSRHGKARAAAEARTYRLRLDTLNRSYWLEREVDSRFVMLESDLGRTFVLPDDAMLTVERGEEVSASGEPAIQFFADGTQTPLVLRLEGQRGDFVRLACVTPGEELRVVPTGGLTP